MNNGKISYLLKWFLFTFLGVSLNIFYWVVFGEINLNSIKIDTLLYLFGRLSGLIGFLFLSLLIFSGETARFFDRFFGMDKIIKFQRKFSLITAVFVLLHPIFFMASSRIFYSYVIPNFAIFPLAVGITSFYLFIIVMTCSLMYKRISHQVWQYIHILIYILFFFGLYHAINWGSSYIFLPVRIIFLVLVISIIIGIIYRTYYKIKQIYSGKFYVKEIIKETEDTFSVRVRSEKGFDFKAGQFYFLRLNKNKLYARHPFSVSSAPWEKDMFFTVKLQGRFTKALLDLKKDEEIIIEGPFGIFTIDDADSDKGDFVFIAGGVGITPFMSIIEDNFKKPQPVNIILLYGSKTEKDIIFKNKLDSINTDWFKKVYILEDNENNNKYEKGYIDMRIIEKYVPNIKNSNFYICGPELMKKNIKKILLKKIKLGKNKIKIEDFFW